MPGGFNASTRRKTARLDLLTKPAGGGTSTIVLPKIGLAARLYLAIRASVAGTLTVPNALGLSSIIRRVTLNVNGGNDIMSLSGAGYSYLLQDELEEYNGAATPQNVGKSAVAVVTGANLDMVLPLMFNMRDPVGLLMLQNEQTTVQLTINWEVDANVATGATVTATCQPYLEFFTVPADPADWPPTNVLHQILEEQLPNAATSGNLVYSWPRGNTYLQVLHGYGIGVTPADNFNHYRLRVNQSDSLVDADLDYISMEYAYQKGRVRNAGVIPVDLLGSSGLGNYGLSRDLFNSALVTDLASIITVTAAGTLYTLRRQLVILG
jgi:hypothetical protein